MDCQISRSDDVALVVIVGSLDSSWSSYLAEQFDEVVRSGAHEVHVDMSGVTYLSSNGIGLLIRYHRQMRQIGGRFRIVADSEEVGHVLKLTGVRSLLTDEGPLADCHGGQATRWRGDRRRRDDPASVQEFAMRELSASRADRQRRQASAPRLR